MFEDNEAQETEKLTAANENNTVASKINKKTFKPPKRKTRTYEGNRVMPSVRLTHSPNNRPVADVSPLADMPTTKVQVPDTLSMLQHTTIPTTPVLPETMPEPQVVRSVSIKKRMHSPSSQDLANAAMLRERCRQICLSLFFRERQPVRSLGFTSSIGGEGKSFLSAVTAMVLANDSREPVTLIECNWENPSLHSFFNCPPSPGFAEWLRQECDESAIQHKVNHKLTVIPAGDGKQDAVQLLQKVRREGILNRTSRKGGLLIVDLPAVATTAYGTLAASLLEALIVVVHAGITPDTVIAETCTQLKDLPVHGLILNQTESQVPRWMRQLL